MRTADASGQSTVELALVLPIALLLVGAVFETGALIGDRARLWHAAREAARVAIVDPDPEAARRAAETASGLSPLTVQVSPAPDARRQGEPLTATLSYRPDASVPLLGPLFETAVLEASVTMRIEQP